MTVLSTVPTMDHYWAALMDKWLVNQLGPLSGKKRAPQTAESKVYSMVQKLGWKMGRSRAVDWAALWDKS